MERILSGQRVRTEREQRLGIYGAGDRQLRNLKLAPGQEEHVSHPIRSLAQAYVYRNQCQPFGIYDEDEIELVVRV